MAATHSSAAQLKNTTARLAALSLVAGPTPSATGETVASKPNETSSAMNLDANEELQNKLKFAVFELLAFATVRRPAVFATVSELFKSCISVVKRPTIQSDASTIIAVILRRLNIAVRDEAERMASPERENILGVLAEWNTALAKFYNWDEQREQFLAPLQVRAFLSWVVGKYHSGDWLTRREKKLFCPRPGGLQDAINFVITSTEQSQADTSTEEQLPQSATPMSPAFSRQSIEHLVTYFSQDDTLDFLWSDEEESDTFDMEESEDGDSDHSIEIFGSATEISGAEVTDSDWSVLD